MALLPVRAGIRLSMADVAAPRKRDSPLTAMGPNKRTLIHLAVSLSRYHRGRRCREVEASVRIIDDDRNVLGEKS
jgi:hypothetical protein